MENLTLVKNVTLKILPENPKNLTLVQKPYPGAHPMRCTRVKKTQVESILTAAAVHEKMDRSCEEIAPFCSRFIGNPLDS